MKKKDLKNAYGDVPQSFHNTVLRTLNRLEESKSSITESSGAPIFNDFDGGQVITIQPKRKSLWRTAAICALAVIVGTAGIFSAREIFKIPNAPGSVSVNSQQLPSTQPVVKNTNDQPLIEETQNEVRDVTLTLTQAENAPEYVKMSVNYMPEGVVENQGKYSLNGNHKDMCFTIVGDRVVDVDIFTAENILVPMKEVASNGTAAFLANVDFESDSGNSYSRRFYIFFEDMAVFVTGYVTEDVHEEEIIKVMQNITVEESSAEDSNLQALSAAKLQKEAIEICKDERYDVDSYEDFFEVPIGHKIGFDKNTDYAGIDFTIKNIEIIDNISELNYSDFNNLLIDINKLVDNNGNFTEYDRNYYDYSDDENLIDYDGRIISKTDKATRCLVDLTIEFNNTSDDEKWFELDSLGIIRGKFENNTFVYYDEFIDNNIPQLYSEDVNYCDNVLIDEHGNNISWYNIDIPANGSKTAHIGFIEDKDQLDNMYILMHGNNSVASFNDYNIYDSYFDPKLYKFCRFVGSEENYFTSYACTKVK